jgi:hypothetical protein
MGSISSSLGDAKRLEAFIAHWQGGEGGQERANYALFLTQFWAALGLPDPDPADHDHQTMTTCSSAWSKRLPGMAPWPIVGPTYKRNCIVLEASPDRSEVVTRRFWVILICSHAGRIGTHGLRQHDGWRPDVWIAEGGIGG